MFITTETLILSPKTSFITILNLNHAPTQSEHSNESLFIAGLVLVCSLALLAIWPLPGTIALRHILLGLGCISSLIVIAQHQKLLFRWSSWPFWIFLGFFFWLLLHLIAFSNDVDAQLYELKHVWMRCLLATPIGLSLGIILTNPSRTNMGKRDWVILLMLTGLSGTCLIGFGRYIYVALHTHQLLNYDVLFAFYKAKPPFVIGAALALPLSFILIIRGINLQGSRWWIFPSLLVIFFTLFAAYFSNTKNGIAIFALTLTLFLISLIFKIHWELRRVALAICIIAIISTLSYVGIKNHIERNSAWSSMIANIKIGVDIEHQNYWKNRYTHPQPLNQYGFPVDVSTYERVAWFTAGSRLLAENPMGYGLLHHSFGSLALAKWPDFYKPVGNLKGATHSGWLDFALGVGVPGLLLVLIPLFVSWYRSLFQEGLWFSYAAWTIPIMSFAYLTTEVAGEHFTELLFFMTAFFCGVTLQYQKKVYK